MGLFGRQRKWDELATDPYTPFQIGRLLGANEMAVALLRREENATAQEVAEVLAATASFFMERSPTGTTAPTHAAPSVRRVEGQPKAGGT